MFRLSFNAASVEPIEEFTEEMRGQWLSTCCNNLADYEVQWLQQKEIADEKRRRAKFLDDMHVHYCKLAGTEPKFTMSPTQAKRYVRARASDCLRAAFETIEHVLAVGSNAPLKDKLDVAYEMLKRAAGPATVVNSMPNVKGLIELAPMDAVDAVMKSYAAGEVDENFVKTLLGLLGAKINSLKVEQELDRKSARKVEDKLKRPPSGKVV